jgi:hypothetical protein
MKSFLLKKTLFVLLKKDVINEIESIMPRFIKKDTGK